MAGWLGKGMQDATWALLATGVGSVQALLAQWGCWVTGDHRIQGWSSFRHFFCLGTKALLALLGVAWGLRIEVTAFPCLVCFLGKSPSGAFPV